MSEDGAGDFGQWREFATGEKHNERRAVRTRAVSTQLADGRSLRCGHFRFCGTVGYLSDSQL
jgi:hypothetical protein